MDDLKVVTKASAIRTELRRYVRIDVAKHPLKSNAIIYVRMARPWASLPPDGARRRTRDPARKAQNMAEAMGCLHR